MNFQYNLASKAYSIFLFFYFLFSFSLFFIRIKNYTFYFCHLFLLKICSNQSKHNSITFHQKRHFNANNSESSNLSIIILKLKNVYYVFDLNSQNEYILLTECNDIKQLMQFLRGYPKLNFEILSTFDTTNFNKNDHINLNHFVNNEKFNHQLILKYNIDILPKPNSISELEFKLNLFANTILSKLSKEEFLKLKNQIKNLQLKRFKTQLNKKFSNYMQQLSEFSNLWYLLNTNDDIYYLLKSTSIFKLPSNDTIDSTVESAKIAFERNKTELNPLWPKLKPEYENLDLDSKSNNSLFDKIERILNTANLINEEKQIQIEKLTDLNIRDNRTETGIKAYNKATNFWINGIRSNIYIQEVFRLNVIEIRSKLKQYFQKHEIGYDQYPLTNSYTIDLSSDFINDVILRHLSSANFNRTLEKIPGKRIPIEKGSSFETTVINDSSNYFTNVIQRLLLIEDFANKQIIIYKDPIIKAGIEKLASHYKNYKMIEISIFFDHLLNHNWRSETNEIPKSHGEIWNIIKECNDNDAWHKNQHITKKLRTVLNGIFNFCINILVANNVFVKTKEKNQYYKKRKSVLRINSFLQEKHKSFWEASIHVGYLPMIHKPNDWLSDNLFSEGGLLTNTSINLVGCPTNGTWTSHPTQKQADIINKMQSQKYKINNFLLKHWWNDEFLAACEIFDYRKIEALKASILENEKLCSQLKNDEFWELLEIKNLKEDLIIKDQERRKSKMGDKEILHEIKELKQKSAFYNTLKILKNKQQILDINLDKLRHHRFIELSCFIYKNQTLYYPNYYDYRFRMTSKIWSFYRDKGNYKNLIYLAQNEKYKYNNSSIKWVKLAVGKKIGLGLDKNGFKTQMTTYQDYENIYLKYENVIRKFDIYELSKAVKKSGYKLDDFVGLIPLLEELKRIKRDPCCRQKAMIEIDCVSSGLVIYTLLSQDPIAYKYTNLNSKTNKDLYAKLNFEFLKNCNKRFEENLNFELFGLVLTRKIFKYIVMPWIYNLTSYGIYKKLNETIFHFQNEKRDAKFWILKYNIESKNQKEFEKTYNFLSDPKNKMKFAMFCYDFLENKFPKMAKLKSLLAKVAEIIADTTLINQKDPTKRIPCNLVIKNKFGSITRYLPQKITWKHVGDIYNNKDKSVSKNIPALYIRKELSNPKTNKDIMIRNLSPNLIQNIDSQIICSLFLNVLKNEDYKLELLHDCFRCCPAIVENAIKEVKIVMLDLFENKDVLLHPMEIANGQLAEHNIDEEIKEMKNLHLENLEVIIKKDWDTNYLFNLD